MIHHIEEMKNQNRPYTKASRQMLVAKLHEAIRLACEQIAVREVSELAGRRNAE